MVETRHPSKGIRGPECVLMGPDVARRMKSRPVARHKERALDTGLAKEPIRVLERAPLGDRIPAPLKQGMTRDGMLNRTSGIKIGHTAEARETNNNAGAGAAVAISGGTHHQLV